MALHDAIQETSLSGCGDGRLNLLHLDNSKCRCDAAPISIGLTRPVEAALTSHHPHKLPQLYMYIYISFAWPNRPSCQLIGYLMHLRDVPPQTVLILAG